MVKKTDIDTFLSYKNIAVTGVSRSGKKFGNTVFKSLIRKDFNVFPINPNAQSVDSYKCYPHLSSVPSKLDGVVTVVPPGESLKIAMEAYELNIKNIWLQPGSESPEVIAFCEQKGMNVIYGECILMFSPLAESVHKFHGWINKLIGKYPV